MRLHTLLVLLVLPSALVIIYLQSRYAHRSDFGTFHPGLPEKRVQEQLQMARAEQQPASVGSSAAAAQPAARERELEEEEEPAHEPQPAAALASEDPAITSHPAESAAAATPAQRYEWHGVHHSGDESAQCTPQPASANNASHRLDWLVPPEDVFPANCDAETQQLCDALRRVAIRREVMVAVCDSNVKTQLDLFLKATSAAGVRNVLIIALDQGLASFLDGLGVAYWLRQDAAKGSHKISAQKFKFMDTILAAGASVLVTDIVGRCPRAHPRKHQQLRRPDLPLTRSGSMSVQDVVYVQDPFKYLHRDSDLEGTTDGWDAATAYGWTEQARLARTHGGPPVIGGGGRAPQPRSAPSSRTPPPRRPPPRPGPRRWTTRRWAGRATRTRTAAPRGTRGCGLCRRRGAGSGCCASSRTAWPPRTRGTRPRTTRRWGCPRAARSLAPPSRAAPPTTCASPTRRRSSAR